MNTDQTVLENTQFDGGDATDQEKELMAQGLGEEPIDPAAAAAAAAAGEGGEPTADAEAQAAAAREAEEAQQREAEAAAERERTEAAQREAQERANAEAARNAEVIARANAAQRPEAPQDFNAAYEALDQKLDDGDIENAEYRAELRKLSAAEQAHQVQVAVWEETQRRNAEEARVAQERANNAWNAAALAWEAEHEHFLSNPMRAQHMQQAINLVQNAALQEGKTLAAEVVLAEAQRIAFDYSGYQSPIAAPAVPATDPKAAIATAVQGRKPATPVQTLGDLPNGGAEPIRGDEAHQRLDQLGIEDLEATVQGMTPDALEKWLADAPGAKAHGRDPG